MQNIKYRIIENELTSKKENINLNAAKSKPYSTANNTINTKHLKKEANTRKINNIPVSYKNDKIINKIIASNPILYNKNNNNGYKINNSVKNNSLSFNIFNLNNNIFTDTISTFSNSLDKINNNINRIKNVNTYQNTFKSNNDNITNYSQRNERIYPISINNYAISANNTNKVLVKKRNSNNLQNNNKIKDYNQKTYNKSINLNKIYNNSLYNRDDNLKTLPNDNLINSNINYKSKFGKIYNNKIQKDNIELLENLEKNIVYKNPYLVNERNTINNINRSREKYYNSNKKENINLRHKKIILNYIYSNSNNKTDINKNINNNNKAEIKPSFSKNIEIIKKPEYNDIRKKHNFYASSAKNTTNNLLMNLNDLYRKTLDLNIIRKNENIDYLITKNNPIINSNIKNNRNNTENLRLLGLLSNSAEKNRNNIINLINPLNLYTVTNSNISNNRNAKTRLNSNIINNISQNINTHQRKNAKNYNNNDINIKDLQFNSNLKLIKKDFIPSSNLSEIYNNNHIYLNDNKNLYNNTTRSSYKNAFNYNLNRNIDSETGKKYDQINRTEGNIDTDNQKININNFQSIKNNNYRYIINNKNNDNSKYIQTTYENNAIRKILDNNNLNRAYFKENIQKTDLNNNYFNIVINNNNQKKQKYYKIINKNNDNKRSNKELMRKAITNHQNLITKYLGNNSFESNSMNNNKIKDIKNISKVRAITNTKTLLSQINPRMTDYLPNKKISDNYVQMKINKIQDPLINNKIDRSFRNRNTIEYKRKGDLNLDINYKQILNNNTYSNNNRSNKMNIFG